MSLTTILLDIDGTLLASNDAHAQSWVQTFAEFGYAVPLEKVQGLIGMGGDKLLPEAVGVEKDSDEGKRLSKRRGEVFRKHYLPTLFPTRGARDLLDRLLADGLALVVATSASGEELGGLLKVAGIADLIEEATTASDAEHSKPDPDIIHAALERGRARADQALMIGDTPYDVEAATKAGVDIIALRSGGWSDDDLEGAVAIYDDPADLLANYVDSPIGRRLGLRAA